MNYFEFELGLAVRRLVNDVLQVKENETIVITAELSEVSRDHISLVDINTK